MTKEKIFEKPVAILGGGVCAQTFAAEFALDGYNVRLYELPEFAPETLAGVLKTHEIELGGKQLNFKWFRRAGTAKVDMVTTEISEALKGAGLIIIAIPVIRINQKIQLLYSSLSFKSLISLGLHLLRKRLYNGPLIR